MLHFLPPEGGEGVAVNALRAGSLNSLPQDPCLQDTILIQFAQNINFLVGYKIIIACSNVHKSGF